MLFNKYNNGALELHNLTGIYFASNDFQAISGELYDAGREVANIVGIGIVSKAEEAYASGTDEQLVKAVQMPIACLAMLRHFRQTGVAHEDSGRKIKAGDDEKVPFEWMLDRDDRALQEKYYRSLDALFAFLEESDLEEWENSFVRKNINRSIVKDIHTFESVYPIEQSRYTFFMLQPLIVEVQLTKLKKALGDAWERISGESVAEGDKTLLYCTRRAAILNAVVIAVERWSIEVFPQSVARRFMPTYQGNRASKSASIEEMEWYLGKLKEQAKEAMQDMLSAAAGANSYEGYPLMPDNDRSKKYFNAGM